jgi:hypothetical protein
LAHRASIYTVSVHKSRHPEELVPLGDIDGSSTYLGDFLVDALSPKTFEAARPDESQDVRCERRQLAGLNNDEVEVLFRPGESGLRADHLEPDGQVAFKQTAQHTQLFTCGSVFRLPRKSDVGLWACHSINRRGPKSMVAPELEKLFRERFEKLRLTFKPSVNGAAFKDALENDRLLEATLIAYERSPNIEDEEAWVDKNTGLKLRLDIEPTGGKRLLADRVLKAYKSRYLGDIVEFGGVKFDSANFKVKLANGTERTFKVEDPEKGFAISEEIEPKAASDGSLEPKSLYDELGRVLTELG